MKKVFNAILKGIRWFLLNLCEAIAVISMIIAAPFVIVGQIFDYIYDKNIQPK